MEVILLEDVKSLGKKGEIVKVSESYGRNCILKKKLGLEATSKNLNDLKLQNANNAKLAKEKLEAAKKLAEEMKEMSVTVKLKSGAGGKTFGSISAKEISVAAKEQLQLELDKKKLILPEPIKSLGCHIVQVKLHSEVTGELTVKVVEE
jgi:large subunit ribosomal protein L9